MTGPGPRPDFGLIAKRYDEYRPADEGWELTLETLLREADLAGWRVLDVGCGTGRLCAALSDRGSKVWGVDASAEMLEVARARLPAHVGLKRAEAEGLPFADGWFDRVVMQMVVHLLDRPAALAEARRVLRERGRIAVCTMDPASFGSFFLCDLFPSIEVIDRARFPAADRLADELRAAGFQTVRMLPLYHEAERSREDAVERIRGRYISTLQLIDDAEYRAGLARAERELPERFMVARELLVAIAE